jgi:glycosyltransferase involved in cell wall biosynthesis
MRILYLCPDLGIPVLGRKGASVHVRSLAAAMTRAGHAVVVAAGVLSKSPWEEPARLEVRLLHLPADPDRSGAVAALKALNATLGIANGLPAELRQILYDRDLAKQLRRHFEHAPPDFVYERAALYAMAGSEVAHELGVPHLVELNAPLAVEQTTYRGTGFGDLAAMAERWLLCRADAVLCVSAPLRDYALSLGVEPDRVQVVPNGVDAAQFRPGPPDPAVRACWGLGGGPVLGFLGGLRPWHGVEVLPALFERVARRHRGARLLFVGDGPLRPGLQKELRERGLDGRAVFTGPVAHEDVPALLRLLDVALAPYPPAGHACYFSPLKLFEYMACGVPVVAAGLGQVAEVVRHGETGLLYPPGDADALAGACGRLLEDPALGRRLGAAAAEEVRGRYTWDRNAARVVELARSLRAARGAMA